MKILSIERLHGPGNTLAIACVQLTDDVRVNGIRVVRGNSGDLRVYSPNAGGQSVLCFSPAAIAELKTLVIDAFGSAKPYEHVRP